MATEARQKLSPEVLTGIVVGSMIGAGIFSLPRTFGPATSPFGAIVASIIAAGGMYMLARVFQTIGGNRPRSSPASCPGHACIWEIQQP